MLWNKAAAAKQHEQISQELTLMEKQCERIVRKSPRSFESKISPWRIINVDTSLCYEFLTMQSISVLGDFVGDRVIC